MRKKRDKEFRNAFSRISTNSLESLLQEELEKSPADEKTVKMLLEELKRREEGESKKCNSTEEKAWARYLMHRMTWENKPLPRKNRALYAAAVTLIVVGMLMFMSQEASAKSIFERISRWTDTFFEMFSPDAENDNQYEYVFQTNHPGLREVYEKAIEIGVTGPAVPMWLPEGSELAELWVSEHKTHKELCARFAIGEDAVIFSIYEYEESSPRKYYISDEPIKYIEIEGIVHSILDNNSNLTLMWTRDNFEFSIVTTRSENEMQKIINSVYLLEDLE
ncbi:MAG: DUF4367 domain-containing protein [Ruminococcaceae bacterium]|nr:DUF4367 domain-containing protein [Oscillospiraceae bacterium]